ncbi:MAG: bifunctional hydroxymethylpyrimidine kinase/phosphomethylpyrimidine kinase [Alphaproteobacteria bacterium]|nr:bifunctional hydroxymethylpyrimidine kinase/phosphomethylpyrimidine kinase [Alphaproteobacteria bacterium SS10]
MPSTTPPNTLSIAGSDPSGGAGIQADLKAISANGGYAMAAITALTAQNTQGVTGVELVAPEFVRAQIDAVFADIEVHAVKVGMIATAEIAAAVADALTANRATNIVLDPVMVAKGGDRLLAEEAVTTLRERLVPLATVITPNLPEAAALTNQPEITRRQEMADLAAALLALGPKAVLLKGGHLSGDQSPDLLLSDQGEAWFDGARVATKNTHGTGCTLSAALATQLALNDSLEPAVQKAKAYIAGAIAGADQLAVGSGHGPTHHFWAAST